MKTKAQCRWLSAIAALTVGSVFAQSGSLNTNNVNVNFQADGGFFTDYNNPRYEVPKGSGNHTLFSAGLWIGGVDGGSQLRLAAQTYQQGGQDFWPGPLDANGTIDSTTSANFDRIWVVTQAQIDSFRYDFFNNGGTMAPGGIKTNILEWPGKNNPYLVFMPANKDLAPFVDYDNDGNYDPTKGDYPAIKGHASAWWVFNDALKTHGNSGGAPLGIEIQSMAYELNCADNPILDNSVFVSLKIINHSNISYTNMKAGLHADFDIGDYADDYVGCDSSSNTFYGFNGDAMDGTGATGSYGANIPVQSITFLNQMMSNFSYYNNDATVTGAPGNDVEYYNYMNSLWKDASPVTFGGNGYGGGQPTTYMYPTSPDQGTGWSECLAGTSPADRRGLGSTPSFTLAPGQEYILDFVSITHLNYGGACISNANMLSNIANVQQAYADTFVAACPAYAGCVGPNCVWPGDCNNDQVVDLYDVLPLGIAYSATGAIRAGASINWVGQSATDWTSSLIIGTNYKHIDCNGDGVVDVLDTTAIVQNFGKAHYKKPMMMQATAADPEFYFVLPTDTVMAGSSVTIPIHLGDLNVPADSIYGMVVTIKFDPAVVDSASINASFGSSWLGTLGSDMIAMVRPNYLEGEVQFVVTRIDQANKSGAGKIGDISFVMQDDLVGVVKDMPLSVSDLQMVSRTGQQLAANVTADTLKVQPLPTGIDKSIRSKSTDVIIYPNPANEMVTIEAASGVINVINTLGQTVYTAQANGKQTIDCSAWEKGVYFVRVNSASATQVSRLLISK